MEEKARDKRSYPRVMVGGETKGRVTSFDDALLLNISLGGALIEHVQPLRPGTLTPLDVELQGNRLKLQCRVVRSLAHRIGLQPNGEQALIYHSGLAFLDLSDDARQVISQYVHSMTEDGSESGTRDREWQEYLAAELEKLEHALAEARIRLEERTHPPDGVE